MLQLPCKPSKGGRYMKYKMKRRILEAVLSVLLVMNVIAVAACGEDKNSTPTPTPVAPVTSKAPTNTPAPTATPTLVPTSTPTPIPTATPTPKPEATKAPTQAPTTAPTVTVAPTEAPQDTTPETGDNSILGILAIAAAASTAAFFTISKLSRKP